MCVCVCVCAARKHVDVLVNTLELLPALTRAGVAAVKIEGRQRSVAYVDKVVHTL